MQSSDAMKVGDWVEVRSMAEIITTLDDRGCLDNMPFMPEMAAFCGARMRIEKSAHKTCDPTGATDLRRLKDTVHTQARCSGVAHGGCEAKCRIFWKTEWLKPVDGPGSEPQPANPDGLELLLRNAHDENEAHALRYRCQTTEIGRASTRLSAASPAQYLQDVSSGNVGAPKAAAYLLRAFATGVASRLFRPIATRLARMRPKRTRPAPPPLGLSAGDIVEVRSAPEILATLNSEGKNRGLVFEKEMLKFCGRRYRVLGRVSRLIDEKSGRLLELKNDCVILDGLFCGGLDKPKRLFCPRAPFYYWREAWLRRAGPAPHTLGEAA